MKRISHSCCQSSYIIVLLLIILFLIIYIYSNTIKTTHSPPYFLSHTASTSTNSYGNNDSPIAPITTIYSVSPPLSDPYVPPLKRNMESPFPPPPQISTHHTPTAFTQVGILTNHEGREDAAKILPLMGRKCRRDKYQYYTVSNEGTKNMKLNIVIHGKNAMNENGVDMLYDRDVVYVPSYRKKFHVEIYENMDFVYSI